MAGDIIVLKFGSSVLRSGTDVQTAVHEIYRWYRAGWRVVAVASAIGNAAETLLAASRLLATEPKPTAAAELLASGQRHGAALVGEALDCAGVPSRVIDPRDIHFAVEGSPLESEPIAVDRTRIEALLHEHPVIVVPASFGYSASGHVHLLGRRGSDLSAVYLARALHANRCRLIKPVDGVYESAGPAIPKRRFASLGYADVVDNAARLIQPNALRLLEREKASVEIAGTARPYESVIGPFDTTFAEPQVVAPLSVLLLGLGTVGFGVYQRLLAMPDQFAIAGALVRDRATHSANRIAPELVHDSVETLAKLRVDVVVDALPGFELSHALVEDYLARGISVVSTNKVLIADHGRELARLGSRLGASLLYSAAVGGSAPMLETLQRARCQGELSCIAGILNGTCNYVLDRCPEGVNLLQAVRLAREHGFAEADATEDLSGRDTARKLRILVRHAFGQEPDRLVIEPLNEAAILRARGALQPDETLRFIARAWKLRKHVFGQVQLEAVDAHGVFAQTRGEWNRLVITRENGENIVVCGRGAGRWPTTEAVIADLLDVRFARQAAMARSSGQESRPKDERMQAN